MQVDVFARADGGDGDDGVLVVRGGDDDGVDVLVGEEVVIAGVAGDAIVGLAGLLGIEVVNELLALFDAGSVEVTDGHDAGVFDLEDVRHVVAAGDATHADGANVDAVAGGHLAEDRRRDDGGEACCCGCSQGGL